MQSVGDADPAEMPGCALRAPARSLSLPQNIWKQGTNGMKKPSSKIREEIARLQDQLKQAETREAERIGRLALKAGLGDIEIDDNDLIAALEEVSSRFRKGTSRGGKLAPAQVAPGTATGSIGEA